MAAAGVRPGGGRDGGGRQALGLGRGGGGRRALGSGVVGTSGLRRGRDAPARRRPLGTRARADSEIGGWELLYGVHGAGCYGLLDENQAWADLLIPVGVGGLVSWAETKNTWA